MLSAFRGLTFTAYGLATCTAAAYARAYPSFDAIPPAPTPDGRPSTKPPTNALRGKRVVVTGANAGLGLAITEACLREGGHVTMVVRSAERGASAAARVAANVGGDAAARLAVAVCDVSSPGEVRAFGDAVDSRSEAVHVLINNAGVLAHDVSVTAQGLESTFATNTLGAYAMTRAMEPALLRGAAGAGDPSRVVTISSGGAWTADLEPAAMSMTRKSGTRESRTRESGIRAGPAAYAATKRQQIALSRWFAAEYSAGRRGGPAARGAPVLFFAMHPGWCDTEGVRSSLPSFRAAMASRLRSPAVGADTAVWLACAPPAGLVSGGYYRDRGVEWEHLPGAGTAGGCTAEAVAALAGDLEALWRRGGGSGVS